jgi:hypothetical protein
MSGKRAPLAGGLAPTELRSVPSEEQAEVEAANPGGGGGSFLTAMVWWYTLLLRGLAILGLVAGFYGLWLLALLVWHWIF